MIKKQTHRRRETLKDKQRAETRGKLIAAGKRLFAAHGYDDVPVTEIAQEAGVTHSMINVYFGGKPGLLYAIVRENNDPQYKASLSIVEKDATARDRLSELLLHWAKADCEDPRMMSIMQSYSWVWPPEAEEENAADRARFKSLIADLVTQGKTAGEVGEGIDPGAAATAIFAIYTWGLRGAVFGDFSAEQCHERIMAQIAALFK